MWYALVHIYQLTTYYSSVPLQPSQLGRWVCNSLRYILYNTDIIFSVAKLIVHNRVGKLVGNLLIVILTILLLNILFKYKLLSGCEQT